MDSENITYSFQEEENIGAAYKKCTLDYQCSQRIVQQYFYRYSADCNGDGVTNCDDYAMLHFNGRALCQLRMDRNELSRNWWKNYTECDPLDSKKFEFY
ncbi:hypothetical protein NQ315_002006 [Exocentrus adspersus]|uniref:lysozyme n=1 Tax=Exocentrus adspersus TaxID=1586481 RepID=A0AAV8WA28_9CUCU|nr:hypothetical protein NQ315_002006 [Exocentrus adspersus]